MNRQRSPLSAISPILVDRGGEFMTVFSNPSNKAILNISLMQRLRSVGGQFVALSELGAERARVWDELEALERFGFQIEHHPVLGVAYRGPTPRLCPDQIEHGLRTRWIGRRIAVWNRVASTNDLAARAASTLANDGLVVLAEEQTAGRGQRGRSWVVPPQSSILMSVLLFPPLKLRPTDLEPCASLAWLTALAAVATAELVSEWTGHTARIKWPNDVRVDGRKIAGILVERALAPANPTFHRGAGPSAEGGVVVGIGLNGNIDLESFPLELRSRATSVESLTRTVIDRSELARDLIRRLDHWYDRVMSEGVFVLSTPWRERSEHLGNLVCVRLPGDQVRGRLVDLDLRHGLTIELSQEQDPANAPVSTLTQSRGRTLRQVAIDHVLALEA
jgi:BirA family biotin operon repressor/biotin-[acetyl-CoA-carboxylase] ligase